MASKKSEKVVLPTKVEKPEKKYKFKRQISNMDSWDTNEVPCVAKKSGKSKNNCANVDVRKMGKKEAKHTARKEILGIDPYDYFGREVFDPDSSERTEQILQDENLSLYLKELFYQYDEQEEDARIAKGGKKETFSYQEKNEFLSEVCRTGGNLSKACNIVGLNYSKMWIHLQKDPEFAAHVQNAKRIGTHFMEDELRRRAYSGYLEPVLAEGRPSSVIRKYDQKALQYYLKHNMPEVYGEKIQVEQKIEEKPSQISAVLEDHLEDTLSRMTDDERDEFIKNAFSSK